MTILEKIIILVHDEINLTLVKQYTNNKLEKHDIEINKLSSLIGYIKKNRIPIFLFFTNNDSQQQVYFIEEFPVISYLNLQMLLEERAFNKIGNYDLKEVIRVEPNKQKYLFVAANVGNFWKNFIKMTSNHFSGIAFLALEAQELIKKFSKNINLQSKGEPRLQLLMFFERNNQVQYLIFIDYIIQQTGFIAIDGVSDKIIEGHLMQNLKDVHELFKGYKKDAYLIIPDEIKQSLSDYTDKNYENIILLSPYEVSIITGTDDLLEPKSRFADLCFIGKILNTSSNLLFNITSQKNALRKRKQHFYLNLSSSLLMLFLCISSVFFYFTISTGEEIYQKLIKAEQRLEAEFKQTKDILTNHDAKNKEKILIYKFLNSNDTSPIECIYDLKKNIEIKSLEWNSAEIHSGRGDLAIKVIGKAFSDKDTVEKEIMQNFNDYDLTTAYNGQNDEVEIILTHK